MSQQGNNNPNASGRSNYVSLSATSSPTHAAAMHALAQQKQSQENQFNSHMQTGASTGAGIGINQNTNSAQNQTAAGRRFDFDTTGQQQQQHQSSHQFSHQFTQPQPHPQPQPLVRRSSKKSSSRSSLQGHLRSATTGLQLPALSGSAQQNQSTNQISFAHSHSNSNSTSNSHSQSQQHQQQATPASSQPGGFMMMPNSAGLMLGDRRGSFTRQRSPDQHSAKNAFVTQAELQASAQVIQQQQLQIEKLNQQMRQFSANQQQQANSATNQHQPVSGVLQQYSSAASSAMSGRAASLAPAQPPAAVQHQIFDLTQSGYGNFAAKDDKSTLLRKWQTLFFDRIWRLFTEFDWKQEKVLNPLMPAAQLTQTQYTITASNFIANASDILFHPRHAPHLNAEHLTNIWKIATLPRIDSKTMTFPEFAKLVCWMNPRALESDFVNLQLMDLPHLLDAIDTHMPFFTHFCQQHQVALFATRQEAEAELTLKSSMTYRLRLSEGFIDRQVIEDSRNLRQGVFRQLIVTMRNVDQTGKRVAGCIHHTLFFKPQPPKPVKITRRARIQQQQLQKQLSNQQQSQSQSLSKSSQNAMQQNSPNQAQQQQLNSSNALAAIASGAGASSANSPSNSQSHFISHSSTSQQHQNSTSSRSPLQVAPSASQPTQVPLPPSIVSGIASLQQNGPVAPQSPSSQHSKNSSASSNISQGNLFASSASGNSISQAYQTNIPSPLNSPQPDSTSSKERSANANSSSQRATPSGLLILCLDGKTEESDLNFLQHEPNRLLALRVQNESRLLSKVGAKISHTKRLLHSKFKNFVQDLTVQMSAELNTILPNARQFQPQQSNSMAMFSPQFDVETNQRLKAMGGDPRLTSAPSAASSTQLMPFSNTLSGHTGSSFSSSLNLSSQRQPTSSQKSSSGSNQVGLNQVVATHFRLSSSDQAAFDSIRSSAGFIHSSDYSSRRDESSNLQSDSVSVSGQQSDRNGGGGGGGGSNYGATLETPRLTRYLSSTRRHSLMVDSNSSHHHPGQALFAQQQYASNQQRNNMTSASSVSPRRSPHVPPLLLSRLGGTAVNLQSPAQMQQQHLAAIQQQGLSYRQTHLHSASPRSGSSRRDEDSVTGVKRKNSRTQDVAREELMQSSSSSISGNSTMMQQHSKQQQSKSARKNPTQQNETQQSNPTSSNDRSENQQAANESQQLSYRKGNQQDQSNAAQAQALQLSMQQHARHPVSLGLYGATPESNRQLAEIELQLTQLAQQMPQNTTMRQAQAMVARMQQQKDSMHEATRIESRIMNSDSIAIQQQNQLAALQRQLVQQSELMQHQQQQRQDRIQSHQDQQSQQQQQQQQHQQQQQQQQHQQNRFENSISNSVHSTDNMVVAPYVQQSPLILAAPQMARQQQQQLIVQGAPQDVNSQALAIVGPRIVAPGSPVPVLIHQSAVTDSQKILEQILSQQIQQRCMQDSLDAMQRHTPPNTDTFKHLQSLTQHLHSLIAQQTNLLQQAFTHHHNTSILYQSQSALKTMQQSEQQAHVPYPQLQMQMQMQIQLQNQLEYQLQNQNALDQQQQQQQQQLMLPPARQVRPTSALSTNSASSSHSHSHHSGTQLRQSLMQRSQEQADQQYVMQQQLQQAFAQAQAQAQSQQAGHSEFEFSVPKSVVRSTGAPPGQFVDAFSSSHADHTFDSMSISQSNSHAMASLPHSQSQSKLDSQYMQQLQLQQNRQHSQDSDTNSKIESTSQQAAHHQQQQQQQQPNKVKHEEQHSRQVNQSVAQSTGQAPVSIRMASPIDLSLSNFVQPQAGAMQPAHLRLSRENSINSASQHEASLVSSHQPSMQVSPTGSFRRLQSQFANAQVTIPQAPSPRQRLTQQASQPESALSSLHSTNLNSVQVSPRPPESRQIQQARNNDQQHANQFVAGSNSKKPDGQSSLLPLPQVSSGLANSLLQQEFIAHSQQVQQTHQTHHHQMHHQHQHAAFPHSSHDSMPMTQSTVHSHMMHSSYSDADAHPSLMLARDSSLQTHSTMHHSTTYSPLVMSPFTFDSMPIMSPQLGLNLGSSPHVGAIPETSSLQQSQSPPEMNSSLSLAPLDSSGTGSRGGLINLTSSPSSNVHPQSHDGPVQAGSASPRHLLNRSLRSGSSSNLQMNVMSTPSVERSSMPFSQLNSASEAQQHRGQNSSGEGDRMRSDSILHSENRPNIPLPHNAHSSIVLVNQARARLNSNASMGTSAAAQKLSLCSSASGSGSGSSNDAMQGTTQQRLSQSITRESNSGSSANTDVITKFTNLDEKSSR